MAQDTLKIPALARKNLKTVLLEKIENLRNNIRRQDIVTEFRKIVKPAKNAYQAKKERVRDDLVTALNRAKQTKDFSESTDAINTVLYMLSELGQVKIETPETSAMSLENSKEPSL